MYIAEIRNNNESSEEREGKKARPVKEKVVFFWKNAKEIQTNLSLKKERSRRRRGWKVKEDIEESVVKKKPPGRTTHNCSNTVSPSQSRVHKN